MLAYVSEQTGAPQVWLVDANGGQPRQLTNAGSNQAPAWSPDDRYVYYSSDRGDQSGIYRYDLAAGKEELVTAGRGLGGPEMVGNQVAFVRKNGGNYELVVGSQVVGVLNRPYDFHWSRDGKAILIDPLQDPRELYRVDVPAARAARVIPPRAWNGSFGPNGEILYTSDNEGVAFIYVANPDGSSPRRLSPSDRWAQSPAWSPDGNTIAYVAGDGPAWNLYAIGADGSNARKLANAANPAKSPVWEPNSGRLAYETNARANWDIAVVDMQGNVRAIATSDANEYDPAWSN